MLLNKSIELSTAFSKFQKLLNDFTFIGIAEADRWIGWEKVRTITVQSFLTSRDNPSMARRLPIGIQDFVGIREDGFVYVDKTARKDPL